MLVLSRHVGQSIIVGDDVRITLIELRADGKVRLGIEAPRETTIHREEIWCRIHDVEGWAAP